MEALATEHQGHNSTLRTGPVCSNPVLSTLRHFRHEYEAHVRDKRCPAGQCLALINFYIEPELCRGCGLCVKVCPENAISGGAGGSPMLSTKSAASVRGPAVKGARLMPLLGGRG